jgi:hypothetical protein
MNTTKNIRQTKQEIKDMEKQSLKARAIAEIKEATNLIKKGVFLF